MIVIYIIFIYKYLSLYRNKGHILFGILCCYFLHHLQRCSALVSLWNPTTQFWFNYTSTNVFNVMYVCEQAKLSVSQWQGHIKYLIIILIFLAQWEGICVCHTINQWSSLSVKFCGAFPISFLLPFTFN